MEDVENKELATSCSNNVRTDRYVIRKSNSRSRMGTYTGREAHGCALGNNYCRDILFVSEVASGSLQKRSSFPSVPPAALSILAFSSIPPVRPNDSFAVVTDARFSRATLDVMRRTNDVTTRVLSFVAYQTVQAGPPLMIPAGQLDRLSHHI